MTLTDLETIVQKVTYRDWRFRLEEMGAGFYLQVEFYAPCARTYPQENRVQHGRKWYISRFATRSEVVQTAFKAVLTAEEHEVREHFNYRGQPIFGPHLDVDQMAELLGGERIRLDGREDRA